MERKRGFNIESYGSGNQVKLPGTAIDKPNCYEFGKTTYEYIYNDLKSKDSTYYTQNGLLNMLDRNRRIKPSPQKFQHEDKEFDVIICLEERVYDQQTEQTHSIIILAQIHLSALLTEIPFGSEYVVDHLHTRPTTSGNPVHVINIDIEDNPEEATIGAWFVCELCGKVSAVRSSFVYLVTVRGVHTDS
ncbi:Ssu72-like protein [Ancylostoma duodenale]|uniref:RNA polymerase II subunit A C-terminal domain phosphatase SSU72 n=1 Tax=Ancylostoma duodenale TaxID=51022 RepID=A0A0C2GNZ2_9BILA|nr:Ssu72-like protein [Ancylostoma duodenale]